MIHAAETKSRVLPPDPDAAKKTRAAMNPGYYNLGDIVRFSVTRRPQDEGVVNEASLIYFPQGKDNVIHKVKLPEGYNTWAAAWEPGTKVLWVSQKRQRRGYTLQSYDFADPEKVKQRTFIVGKIDGTSIYKAAHAALSAIEPATQEQEPLPPADSPSQEQKPEPVKPAATPPPASPEPGRPD